ncbi:hypothetical protein PHJA_001258400 [Phtheirospermum japonicum]|uniref:FHA domain-containing protein n=1 Tax=Phtheirospermum japonicum TaxID=374723 RepID=A0A830C4E2_9LAMI|nr:hypothetical protein PHJA_001258400 [Phtheirospermum japonicum]
MDVSAHSYANPNSAANAPFFPPESSVYGHKSVNFVGYNCLPRNLKCSASQLRNFGVINAADYDNRAVKWLLQPIGDGDSRHIGYEIEMPGPFEISSNVVSVGRDGEKADIVVPVPTVSALHARIQKTQDNLLITDLDSTNGTFIDETRLQPGVIATALPGNLITFGDTNLAIFKVYKLENEGVHRGIRGI